MAANPPPPQTWPKEYVDLYSPVRIIGKGGFGNVYMATAKRKESSSSGDSYVAIKVVGNDSYSQREVAILSELSQTPHRNIVRLINDFQENDGSGHHIIVMSLHRGPTLKHIIEKRGALGMKIGQCISKQLVDAIAYLHGHAVIHRDIHPANLIISGASLDDDLWWSDDFDAEGKVRAMTKKCHLTLIDFGFARALAAEDIDESIRDENDHVTHANTKPVKVSTDNPSRGRSRIREDIGTSYSRYKVRDLSALGTRNYAAPEILSGIRNVVDSIGSSFHRRKTRRNCESECIADYGMVADAYSVGVTICHLITGVPPDADEDDFISSKNHPLKKIARKVKASLNDKKGKRAKTYRRTSDLPLEVNEVIRLLTHYDARRRCTVRYARGLPWIKEGDEVETTDENSCMNTGGPVNHLRCSDGGQDKDDKW